jgi:hypothetical protein
MDQPFDAGEEVTVEIQRSIGIRNSKDLPVFAYSFTISPLTDYQRETLLREAESGEDQTVYQPGITGGLAITGIDTLPDDFPVFIIHKYGETAPGLLIGASKSSNSAVGDYRYIMDDAGTCIYYEKKVATEAGAFDMQVNGFLSCAEPVPGDHSYIHRIVDTTYAVVDSFQMGNGYIADNHDFKLLPNGHALMFAYDLQPYDMSLIVQGGDPNALIYGAVIQEVDGDGNVIFQWRSWDYYDVADSYEDLTKKKFDAIHVNSIDQDPDGNIIISARALCEITKISRSTGEMVWRLGGKNNEFSYIGEDEENAPTYFKYQHGVRILPDGHLIFYDNGAQKKDLVREYSRAVEYRIDEENKTATLVWEYRHDPEILSLTGGSVQRLSNGNSMITWGDATDNGAPSVTEIQPDGTIVFEMFYEEKNVRGGFSRNLWKTPDIVTSVMLTELMDINRYEFNDPGDTTGVSMVFNALYGFIYNEVTVHRTPYGPLNPEFEGEAPYVFPYRLFIEESYIDSFSVEIYFDLGAFPLLVPPEEVMVYGRPDENSGVFTPLGTIHLSGSDELRINVESFGEFIFARPDVESMLLPPLLHSPYDGERVNNTLPVHFTWSPQGLVNHYQIQIARDSTFTEIIAQDSLLTETTYTMNSLMHVQTHFWRVRSFNSAGTGEWSGTWRFTASPPYITVNVPNGGEEWEQNSRVIIRWEDNFEGDVVIDLLKSETYVSNIDTLNSSTHAFQWRILNTLEPDSDYKIRITSVADPLVTDQSDSPFTILGLTGILPERDINPDGFALYQNFPNPFNNSTSINFHIAEDGFVRLKIYHLSGQEVCTLVHGRKEAGSHSVLWNGTDTYGAAVSSGVYFIRLQSGENTAVQKIVLLK